MHNPIDNLSFPSQYKNGRVRVENTVNISLQKVFFFSKKEVYIILQKKVSLNLKIHAKVGISERWECRWTPGLYEKCREQVGGIVVSVWGAPL